MVRQQVGGFWFQPIRVGQSAGVGSTGPAPQNPNDLQLIAAGFDQLVPGLSKYLYETRKDEVKEIRKAVVNLVEANPELRTELQGATTAEERAAVLAKYRKAGQVSPLDDPAGMRFLGVMNAASNFETYSRLLEAAEARGEYKSRLEVDENGNQILVPGKTFNEVAAELKGTMGYMDADGEAEFNRLMTINRGDFSKRWEEARIRQDREVSKEATYRGLYTDAISGDTQALQKSFDSIYEVYGQEAPEVSFNAIRFASEKALMTEGMDAVNTLLYSTYPSVRVGLSPLGKNPKFQELRLELIENLQQKAMVMSNTAYQKRQRGYQMAKDSLVEFGYTVEGNMHDLWSALQEKAAEIAKDNPDAGPMIRTAAVDAYENVVSHTVENADVLLPALPQLLRDMAQAPDTATANTLYRQTHQLEMPRKVRDQIRGAFESRIRQLEVLEKSPKATAAISSIRQLRDGIPKDIPYEQQQALTKILQDAEGFAVDNASWSTDEAKLDEFSKRMVAFEDTFNQKRSDYLNTLVLTKNTWADQITAGLATEEAGIELMAQYGPQLVNSFYLAPLNERINSIQHLVNNTEVAYQIRRASALIAANKMDSGEATISSEELQSSIQADIVSALSDQRLYNGVPTKDINQKAVETLKELTRTTFGLDTAKESILRSTEAFLKYDKVNQQITEINTKIFDEDYPYTFLNRDDLRAKLKGKYKDNYVLNDLFDYRLDAFDNATSWPAKWINPKVSRENRILEFRRRTVAETYVGMWALDRYQTVSIESLDKDALKDPALGSLAILPSGITLKEYEAGQVKVPFDKHRSVKTPFVVEVPFNKKDVDPMRVFLFPDYNLEDVPEAIDRMIAKDHELLSGMNAEQLSTFRSFQLYAATKRN